MKSWTTPDFWNSYAKLPLKIKKQARKAYRLWQENQSHPYPDDGEEGCVLEVFNALGESIGVLTVPISAVKSLSASEILIIRSLKQVS